MILVNTLFRVVTQIMTVQLMVLLFKAANLVFHISLVLGFGDKASLLNSCQ